MNPPPFSPPGLSSKDEEHLKLLSIFHYVLVVFAVLGMIFLFIHYMIFTTIFNNPKIVEQMRNQPNQGIDPREFMAIFQWFYVFMGVCLLLAAIGNFLSGWYIREKMNRTFSLFVAGLNCLCVPIGTVLGVFTIIVLTRESVRTLYNTSLA